VLSPDATAQAPNVVRQIRPEALTPDATAQIGQVEHIITLVLSPLSVSAQPKIFQVYGDLQPTVLQSTASVPVPTVSPFHTFQAIKVTAGFTDDRTVLPEFIDQILVPV
jgi:hypothetical protein